MELPGMPAIILSALPVLAGVPERAMAPLFKYQTAARVPVAVTALLGSHPVPGATLEPVIM